MARAAALAQLPTALPVFPLTGALLLPRGKLPLNIFEPRYRAMIDDALAGDRLIGMVQPAQGTPEDNFGKAAESAPSLYPTGCAGRITSFSETEDGRYLIALTGLCRFSILREIEERNGYRRVEPAFAPYARDLAVEDESVGDRPRLLDALKRYLAQHQLTVDWDAIRNAPDDKLVTSLAMVCPFAPSEKQALLQSPGLAERAEVMTALLEMALAAAGTAVQESSLH